MRNFQLFGFLSLVLILTLSSCLTCEVKTYKFEFTGKGKGRLTVTYQNIFSTNTDEEINSVDQAEIDFEELIYDYMEGEQLMSQYPNAKLVSRRLYEANGKLNGEVIYEFTDISQVNLFQTDKKGPFMFMLNSFSFENFVTTNGTFGPEYFKAVYWSNKMKMLELTTSIDAEDESATPLLKMWKAHKK